MVTSLAARAPVYVLVHGIGTSHRYFTRLHEQLVGDAQVFMVDLPGFGGLPKPASGPDIAEMSGILAAAIDELGVTDAIVVGHSMGAQWVTELAIQRPDLVSGIVLIGPVSDDRHRSYAAQSAALLFDILGEPPLTNAVVLLDYLRAGPAYFLRQCRPMLSYPIERAVAEVAADVLVLRGGNDPIAGPDWCRRLASSARAGYVVTVPKNRHVVMFTAPKAVAGALRDFVARIERRGGANSGVSGSTPRSSTDGGAGESAS